MNELPIPRTTLTEMALAYRQSEADIRTAYGLLVAAQQRLKDAFQVEHYEFSLESRERQTYAKPDNTMELLKRTAWRCLVNKMGVRSAMSIKRAGELEQQLSGQSQDPLPEITEANILAIIEQTFNTLPQMLEENVREVFDWLRPASAARLEYKTNQKSQWKLEQKLILGWMVQGAYSTANPFRPNYHKDRNLIALDNVFSMLDGKGMIKTHYGPLYNAITSCGPEGRGATEYFEFRCFQNGNLHLKFLRSDLVDKLNLIAGGMRIADIQQKAA